MFLGPVLNGAGRFDGPLIMDIDIIAHAGIGAHLLLYRVIAIAILFADLRDIVWHDIQGFALLAHFDLVHGIPEAGKNCIPIAGDIINRDMPLGDGHFIGHRNGDCLGEDLIGDADMHCLSIQVPQRHDAQAVIGRFHIILGRGKSRRMRVIGISVSPT